MTLTPKEQDQMNESIRTYNELVAAMVRLVAYTKLHPLNDLSWKS